jgi:outer membrane protein OmpA-like peptidoglycan-associated protein
LRHGRCCIYSRSYFKKCSAGLQIQRSGILVGRTSLENTDEHNIKLSQERAENLKKDILNEAKNKYKLSDKELEELSSRITTKGVGESGAKDADKSGDDPQDRRTDVVFN